MILEPFSISFDLSDFTDRTRSSPKTATMPEARWGFPGIGHAKSSTILGEPQNSENPTTNLNQCSIVSLERR